MIHRYEAKQTNSGLDFNISLESEKKVYCFIGENGVGKTQLLENMARCLLFTHSFFFNEVNQQYKYSNIFFNKEIVENIGKVYLQLPVYAAINDLTIKNNEQQWGFTQLERVSQFAKPIVCDKPIVFIGAKNRGYTKNLSKDCLKILGDTMERFLEAFTQTFEAMNGNVIEDTRLSDWITSRLIINPSFVVNNQNRGYEVVTLLDLIGEIDSKYKMVTRNGSNISLDVLFNEGKLLINNTPIDKLPTGLLAVLKVFQEIIAGFGSWIAFKGDNDIRNTDGIVFIDEIESHLHPKWQCRIIPLLKTFFPRATFYITTHSPVIVSNTEEGEAYEIVKGDFITAKKLGNPRNWYLADVFSQAFHIELLGNYNDLEDNLLKFSSLVKDQLANPNDTLMEEIKSLYNRITPSLPEGDPRRESLEYLWGLLK